MNPSLNCWKKNVLFDMLRSVKKKAFLIQLVAGLCLVLLIKNYVVEIRQVSGNSMLPSVQNGSFIVIWKLAYGIPLFFGQGFLFRWAKPLYGDIVFYPIDGKYVIKRCAGTEGTVLHFSTESAKKVGAYGVLQLPFVTVSLSLTQFKHLGGFLPQSKQVIPTGFILALGDNAAQSHDSRDYGFISVDSVYGKVLWK